MEETLYQIADELRAAACHGLTFSKNPYDREQFERVLTISAQLVAVVEQRNPDEVVGQFHDNLLHVSPLVGAEAVVVRHNQVLLIRRRDDGLWALPGGLSEVGETLVDTALRELWEETRVCGRVVQLLGIFDSNIWQSRWKAQIYGAIFLVETGENEPKPTAEAADVGFFGTGDLPPLSPGHHLRVPFIFKLLSGEVSPPYFDPPTERIIFPTSHWQHRS